MPYEFLPEIATADIAFRASGESLEELFVSASDAMMKVMIENLQDIQSVETRTIHVEDSELDLLLFDALQELIYYKDAEQLLLRFTELKIVQQNGKYHLTATAVGEALDPARHEQRADVKAVTFHHLHVSRANGGWEATVVLDI